MPPVHIKDLRVWKVKYGLTREGFLAYVAEKGQKPDLAEARKNRSALTPLTTGDEFFHDGSTAYVTTTVKECRRETFRVNSTEYAEVLSYRHDQQKGKAPSKQAIGEWQATLCGRAKHDGPPRSVYVRIAYDKESNCIYFDLADAERHVVQISSDGWKVIRDTDCEVRFIRPHGQLGLPLPVSGGSLDELCPLLNVPSDDFPLIPGWLLGVFLPMGEMPGLAFSGQQGSGKSEACRMLRQLVDPAEVDNRPLSDERNLFVAAGNLFVLLFDNLSSIPPTMADVLCRLLSGSGYAIRQNYSDNQEILFRGRRPLLFNGIPSELCDRADLRDRVICVNLPPIDSKHRKSKTQLQDYFEAARPRILGALLSAVATALKRRDEVQITESPRMADFFRFVVAAEPSLPFPAGSFARAYEQDRRAATDLALENSVVATTILRLLSKQPTWEGTSKQLLAEIDDPAYSRSRESWDTPKNPKAVSIALQRIAPALRARGIEFTKGRHTEGGNLICLRRISG
jgi:putative DNA primase/helicase